MRESLDTPQDPAENDKEWKNASIGYQMAISLWAYQGQQVGARFNIMLVANSIVIAAIALALTSRSSMSVFTKILPIAGVFLCIFWFLLMKRETKYADYYIKSACELEENYLAPVVTVSRGALLAKGREVTLKCGCKDEPFQMDCWARLLRAKTIFYLVIVLFILLYAAIIFQDVWSGYG